MALPSDTQTAAVSNDSSTSLNVADSKGSSDLSSSTDLATNSSTSPEASSVASTSDKSKRHGGRTMGQKLNRRLRNLIGANNIQADPSIGLNPVDIDSPIAQLGMKLFSRKASAVRWIRHVYPAITHHLQERMV